MTGTLAAGLLLGLASARDRRRLRPPAPRRGRPAAPVGAPAAPFASGALPAAALARRQRARALRLGCLHRGARGSLRSRSSRRRRPAGSSCSWRSRGRPSLPSASGPASVAAARRARAPRASPSPARAERVGPRPRARSSSGSPARALAAAVVAGPGARTDRAPERGSASPAGILYAAGDVATKEAASPAVPISSSCRPFSPRSGARVRRAPARFPAGRPPRDGRARQRCGRTRSRSSPEPSSSRSRSRPGRPASPASPPSVSSSRRGTLLARTEGPAAAAPVPVA